MPVRVPGRLVSLGALVFCVAHGALGSGCASAPRGAAAHVTTPTAPPVEPRGPTGQQLEDLFFTHVAGTPRFDIEAALDEVEGADWVHHEDTAGGEYYDETAAGAEDEAAAGRERAFIELREVHQQVVNLEQGLHAESHPLEADITEVRARLGDVLEYPDEYSDAEGIVELQSLALSMLYGAADSHVRSNTARPGHPTDCSVATLALYGALYETLVEVSAAAHLDLHSYVTEQELWLDDQRLHMSVATDVLEWLDAHSTVGVDDPTALDELISVMDGLHDVEEYLTAGSGAELDAALDRLYDAETDAALRAELRALRSAVLATLANVAQPPYVAEIQAYEGIQHGLYEAYQKVRVPGPRAALRALRHHQVQEHLARLEWSAESFVSVVSWTRMACEEPAVSRP